LRVVAVIPAFNAETTIADMVQRTLNIVDSVLVIDDGSVDLTSRRATDAGAIVKRLPKNYGKGYALRTGLMIAISLDPQLIVTLDADTQHLPEQIPQLLAPIINGQFDVVVGTRFRRGAVQIPFIRLVSNMLSTHLIRLVTGLSKSLCTDSQCGFRAFGKNTFRTLSNLTSDRFNIEAETLIQTAKARFRITEVPIFSIYSHSIKSHMKPSREIPTFLRLILKEGLNAVFSVARSSKRASQGK